MPQMAPIWWTTMYFTFILSFLIMFFMLFFHSHQTTLNKKNKSITHTKINWKW
uniref:ATP synthase complex subunit 8 n=1 Tax=Triatoma migrans TaxID=2579797 RepID=A0A4P8NQE7_9HEMI|nr:ATP synthase F0 subunit 8 [Triatoma migrans]QCQ69464.1 ATP synthase F0 subunit 8 [Triatoma migrans]